ncbi:MAG: aminomethyltransferase family protein [Anaerolineales bacterium]|nr:aminomethyltransferase family protein [Anaerolineales bacterium]
MKRSPFFPNMLVHNPNLGVVQDWEVANTFTSIGEEHQAVRERVGLVDWSTTGEFEIKGPDALEVVQGLIVNDASRMPVNRVLYSTILNPDGGIASDITVYRLASDHFMLMTAWGSNAAGERPEYNLLVEHSRGKNACVFDGSPGYGLIALQGPASRELLSELTDTDISGLEYMWTMPARVAGVQALISRTGYTGELGYEILIPAVYAQDFWTDVTGAGEKYGLALVGLGACFSLRIEKGYIMRHDFVGGRTPYEIRLGWTVKLDKGDFIGRDALVRRKEAGFSEKLATILIEDDYVPPAGDRIFKDGKPVGQTTSAAFGYTLGRAITLGYVPVDLDSPGTKVEIVDQAGAFHIAEITVRSPYDPEGKRIRS